MDHRAIGDAAAINATAHRVLDYVGGVISPEMQTPKLRWVKRELPRTWQRTARWFDLPDYLTWRATGSDDRSLCSTVCKWTYLGHERRWDPTYFDAIGLGDLTADSFRKIGSRVRVPGERLGALTPAAAADFGLSPGIAVATSMIDAHAGALGTLGASGHAAPISKRMAIIAGTSACHLATAPAGTSVHGVWGPYYEALLPNEWLLEAGISASGAFLDHVLRSHPAYEAATHTFAGLEQRLTDLLGRGATVQELTHDLHLQPNVLGNRAPLADPTLARRRLRLDAAGRRRRPRALVSGRTAGARIRDAAHRRCVRRARARRRSADRVGRQRAESALVPDPRRRARHTDRGAARSRRRSARFGDSRIYRGGRARVARRRDAGDDAARQHRAARRRPPRIFTIASIACIDA